MHAVEVSAERVLVGRHVGADVAGGDVLILIVHLNDVQLPVGVAEEALATALALEAQVLLYNNINNNL